MKIENLRCLDLQVYEKKSHGYDFVQNVKK